MSKVIWLNGPPISDGIFWFNSGNGIDLKHGPLIAQTIKNDTDIFGEHGTFPLNIMFNKTYAIETQHAVIEKPTEWKELSLVLKHKRMWIRNSIGYIGFGMLEESGSGLSGTIIWLDHPNYWSHQAAWIRQSDNYLFSPVEIPTI